MFVIEVGHLTRRVAAGATVAELARELSVDRSVMQRELSRAGLTTARQRGLAIARQARARGAVEIELTCPAHGALVHRIDARGTHRCPQCNAMRVARHRRSVKEQLVVEAGGACLMCGYARCARALSFHHVDPTSKSFDLALGGVSRSLAKARAEAAKCVLLCANCHMEVETGMPMLPLDSPRDRG